MHAGMATGEKVVWGLTKLTESTPEEIFVFTVKFVGII
jgi:hypothetical protein